MRIRIAAVLACLAVAAAGKPNAPDAGVRWATTWAGAVEEARALNLPLIVHRHGFYWSPCWSVHRAVFDNKAYIKFSRKNCVEVMAMQDIERALAEKPKRAATYETRDAYGDEIECFVQFPGVTIAQMRALIEGPALEYMVGPLMPYMGVVDPHTLKTIGGVKRGEPYTASHFIAAIKPHVGALQEKYGKGVPRKAWDGVKEGVVKVDLALGKNGIVEAMAVLREMATLAGPRPPDTLKRRLDSTVEVILGDAGIRLDELEARIAKGEGAKVRSEVAKLAKALEATKLEKRAVAALAAAKKE